MSNSSVHYSSHSAGHWFAFLICSSYLIAAFACPCRYAHNTQLVPIFPSFLPFSHAVRGCSLHGFLSVRLPNSLLAYIFPLVRACRQESGCAVVSELLFAAFQVTFFSANEVTKTRTLNENADRGAEKNRYRKQTQRACIKGKDAQVCMNNTRKRD